MKPKIAAYQDGRTVDSNANRAEQMDRRSDVVKVPKVTLFDIDFGIFYHLQEVWKPKIIENDVSIPVPVMFSNGEKWAQVRSMGYLRDASKKIQSPLIIIKRNDVANDDRIAMFPGQTSTFANSTKLIPYRTNGMQYDKVAGQYARKESVEYYLLQIPTYVRLTYDLIIWTDLQEQMNVLVQQLIDFDGHMWGDYWKFRTVITSTAHENVNIPGEDRLVKTTMALQVDGYLRNEFTYQESNIQKAYSIKTVKFLQEGTEQILFDQIADITQPNIDPTSNRLQTGLKRNIR